jgi:hypothetical protein
VSAPLQRTHGWLIAFRRCGDVAEWFAQAFRAPRWALACPHLCSAPTGG